MEGLCEVGAACAGASLPEKKLLLMCNPRKGPAGTTPNTRQQRAPAAKSQKVARRTTRAPQQHSHTDLLQRRLRARRRPPQPPSRGAARSAPWPPRTNGPRSRSRSAPHSAALPLPGAGPRGSAPLPVPPAMASYTKAAQVSAAPSPWGLGGTDFWQRVLFSR